MSMQSPYRRLMRLILRYTRDPADRARALELRRRLRAADQRWHRMTN